MGSLYIVGWDEPYSEPVLLENGLTVRKDPRKDRILMSLLWKETLDISNDKFTKFNFVSQFINKITFCKPTF